MQQETAAPATESELMSAAEVFDLSQPAEGTSQALVQAHSGSVSSEAPDRIGQAHSGSVSSEAPDRTGQAQSP